MQGIKERGSGAGDPGQGIRGRGSVAGYQGQGIRDTIFLILNILLNKMSKRIEPEAVVLIEGSLLTKYTRSHAHQYTIQRNMHSNFGSCELPTNAH